MFGVVLAVAQPAIAQQTGPETNPAVKDQVTRFENLVKMAIQEAGQLLVREVDRMTASQIKMPMNFDAAPVASGVVIPDVGPHFDVQIPGIQPSNLQLWALWQQDPFYRKVDPRQGTRQVATTPPDKVSATNNALPNADAMTSSPAVDFDPTRAYTNFAREKLIDTLLDYSRVLPLKPGERVVIVAKDMLDIQPLQPTQLSGRLPRQLVLSIKSEDLIALNDGKITRDEAKQRIVDTRF
jgi:hypothetical protein